MSCIEPVKAKLEVKCEGICKYTLLVLRPSRHVSTFLPQLFHEPLEV